MKIKITYLKPIHGSEFGFNVHFSEKISVVPITTDFKIKTIAKTQLFESDQTKKPITIRNRLARGGDFDPFDRVTEILSTDSSVSEIVFNDDMTMRDVRMAIYAITNIPPECQHIEYVKETGVGTDYKVYERIGRQETEVTTNLQEYWKPSSDQAIEMMFGMMVDVRQGSNPEVFRVESLMNHSAHMADVTEIIVFNFLDFIEDKPGLAKLASNSGDDGFDLLYYGFIEKFFPMIPAEGIVKLLIEGDMYGLYPWLQESKTLIVHKLGTKRALMKNKPSQSIVLREFSLLASQLLPTITSRHMLSMFDSIRIAQSDSREGIVQARCWVYNAKQGYIKCGKSVNKLNTFGSIVNYDFLEIMYKMDYSVLSRITITKDFIQFHMNMPASYDRDDMLNILTTGDLSKLIKAARIEPITDVRVEGVSQEYMLPHSGILFDSLITKVRDLEMIVDGKVVEVDYAQSVILIKPDIYRYKEVFIKQASSRRNEFMYMFEEDIEKATISNKNSKASIGFGSSVYDWLIRIRLTHTNIVIGLPIIDDRFSRGIRDSLLLMFDDKFLATRIDKSLLTSRSKIKILKETDPILYDLGGGDRYSRACQGDAQPIIVSADVAKSKPDKYMEYWNFTRGEPIFYGCDSKDTPHVKFLSDIHPKGYCIPCCKKKALGDLMNEKSKYAVRHLKCLNSIPGKTDSVQNKIQNISEIVSNGKSSRYVSNFNVKSRLEPKRLQNCSESVSVLMHDSKAGDVLHAIVGVPQIYNSVHLPCIYCVAFAFDTDVNVLISEILRFWSSSKKNRKLCESITMKYLPFLENPSQLWETISNRNTYNLSLNGYINNANEAMLHIMSEMGIEFIEFVDDDTDGHLRTHIAYRDYQVWSESSSDIVVICSRISSDSGGKKFSYPLCKISLKDYFRRGDIMRKSFHTDDISTAYSTIKSGDNNPFSFDRIYQFCSNSRWHLKHVYVDSEKRIRFVCMSGGDGIVLVEVPQIRVNMNIRAYPIESLSTKRAYKRTLDVFIADYRKKNKIIIKPEVAMVVGKELVGMTHTNDKFRLTTLLSDKSATWSSAKCECRVIDLPETLAAISIKAVSPYKDEHTFMRDLESDLYKTSLYTLFKTVIFGELANSKNFKIRLKIKRVIESETNKAKALSKINDISRNMYDLASRVSTGVEHAVWVKSIMNIINATFTDDDEKYIHNIMTNKEICSEFIDEVTSRRMLSKGLDRTKPFVEGDCSDLDVQKSMHCSGNKLLISKEKIKDYSRLMVEELTNPFNRRVISRILKDKTYTSTNNFLFTERSGTDIYEFSLY